MRKRKGVRLPVLAIVVSLVILAGIVGYGMRGKITQTDRADEATEQSQIQQAEAKVLAEGIKRACALKAPEVAAYCERAQKVIEQKPIEGPPGPPGDQGVQGVQGVPGKDGSPGAPGRDGSPGAPGKDGSPGTPGKDGEPGSDGEPGVDGRPGADGSPGVPGKDGEPGADGQPGKDGEPGADGQPGKDGSPGQDGRGVVSVTCAGPPQTFHFTFTDGTTQTVECSPVVTPSPTATPTPDE